MSTSVVHQMNSAQVFESYEDFNNTFDDTKEIDTDENTSSTDKSITAIGVGDCIAVFAMEKANNVITEIIGWHFDRDSNTEEIEERFDDHANSNLNYDIYVIGGTADTTNGNECLLNRINNAIANFFTNHRVLQRLINLNNNTNYNYISANLNMLGTLSYCRHN
jgi:hypothetical protein